MDKQLRDLKKKSQELKIKNNLVIDKSKLANKTIGLTSGSKIFSIGIELLAFLIAGLIIGNFLDRMLSNDKPIALMICLILSCLAGLRKLFIIK